VFKEHFIADKLLDLEKNPFKEIKENEKIFTFLKNLWIHNFNKIGFAIIPEQMFQVLKEEQNFESALQQIEEIFQNKDFKRHARRSRRFGTKMSFSYELIRPYVQNQTSFLDFGCGKMALLRRLAKEKTSFQKLYGYDPASNPGEINFDQRVEFITTIKDLESLSNIDIVHASYVFHHLTAEEIRVAFKVIHKILKPGGIFIFIDEAFPEEFSMFNLQFSIEKLNSIGYQINNTLTEEFNSLNEKERFLTIYLNDVLINLKNLTYMPWTFEYRSLEEWRREIESFGFIKNEEYFFGIAENERLKQGITSLQLYKKL
jgi:SAM-dependent methyltransferase